MLFQKITVECVVVAKLAAVYSENHANISGIFDLDESIRFHCCLVEIWTLSSI